MGSIILPLLGTVSLFRLIVFIVMVFAWLFLYFSLFSHLSLKKQYKACIFFLLGALILFHPAARLFSSTGLPFSDIPAFHLSGYILFGVITLLVPFVLLNQSMQLVYKIFNTVQREEKIDTRRRQFLYNAGSIASLAVTTSLATVSLNRAFSLPQVNKVFLYKKGLPAALEGITLVQLSDLHIGYVLTAHWLDAVIDQVAQLDADIVVLTGDAVDGSVAEIGPELRHFAALTPRRGKFFVTGNHEFYSGVTGWLSHMQTLGFTTLNNEHVLIRQGQGKLLLAGVWDYRGHRFGSQYRSDPLAAKQGAADHDVSILLAHQPRSVFQAAEAGFDVQLSGHTHGGQYFPGTLLIGMFQPFVQGFYTVGATTLYVNTGTGFWGPPFRTVMPEITHYTLTGSPQNANLLRT